MKKNIRRRGQKYLRRFSRVSVRASEGGREHIQENLIERISHITNIRLLIVEWGLLVVAVIMLAVAQAFWFGSSYSENVFTAGGTYTEASLGEVKTLNPLFATTDSEKTLSRLLFSTLVKNDYSGHIGMDLAESVTPNDDATVWTLKLKDGLKWSDNEPITIDDVAFTIGLIKNPAVSTVFDSSLANVKVTADENGGVVFNLPATHTDFVTALNIPILPKHILGEAEPNTLIEHSFSTSPISSGPFSFNAIQPTSVENEKVYYLSANPNYHASKAFLNTFAVHTYSSKENIITALNNGTVTATAELSGDEPSKITSGQFNEKNSSIASGAFVFLNTSNGPMKNAEFRNAIRQGINISKVREAAPGTTPIDYPILPSQISLSKYPEIPGYNTVVSKEIFNSYAGEEGLHLDMVTVNSGYLPKVSETIKSELEELGIEVNLTVYEESQEFINEIISRRNYDILVYEIELGTSPDLLPYYHSSQANSSGLNLSNYRNTLSDDFLLGARDAMDEELRVKKYESFLESWVSNTPAIALYQSNLIYIYNKNVRSYGDDVDLVTALDRFVDIDNWATVKETKNKTP